MRTLGATLFTVCFLTVSLLSTGGSLLAQEGTTEAGPDEVRTESMEKLRSDNEALKKELQELRALIQELKGQKKAEEVVRDTELLVKEQKKKADGELQKAMEQLQVQMDRLQLQREGVMNDISEAIKTKEKSLEDFSENLKKAQDEARQRQEIMADAAYAAYMDAFALKQAEGAYKVAPDPTGRAYDAAKLYSLGYRGRELETAMLSHGDAGLATMLRFEKVKLYRKQNMYDRAAEELRRIIARNLNGTVTNAARWTLVEVLQEQEKQQAALAELEKILNTTQDPRKKKDAIYGIINLLGEDPQSKIRTIEGLIRRLEGRQPTAPSFLPPEAPEGFPTPAAVEPSPGFPGVSAPVPSTFTPASPFGVPSTPAPGTTIAPLPTPSPPAAPIPAPGTLPSLPRPAPGGPPAAAGAPTL